MLTLFELLKQMSEGTETDPETRIAELRKRRAELEAEIDRIEAGDIPLLDATGLKDRFQQFTHLARELLADFREVEHNFRGLDRRVRERIALWEGAKGELLEEIMGERDAIADSDQGRSFRAFWDFLMSSRRQEELTQLLDRVLSQPPVVELRPDPRTRRVHYDWLEAGEHTQRTVAQLSQQLRRFLDDQAWLENRRIMDILHGIEAKALALRDAQPAGEVMDIAEMAADIELPMERPLYTPPLKPLIADLELEDRRPGRGRRGAVFPGGHRQGRAVAAYPPCVARRGASDPPGTVRNPALAAGLGGTGGLSAIGERCLQGNGGRGRDRRDFLADRRWGYETGPFAAGNFREMRMDRTGTAATAGGTEFSAVVVPLLKGVIYREGEAAPWNALLSLQARVRDYVAVLGLDLVLDEAEGYAFLRSRPESRTAGEAAASTRGAAAAGISREPSAGAAPEEAGGVRRKRRRHPLDSLP